MSASALLALYLVAVAILIPLTAVMSKTSQLVLYCVILLQWRGFVEDVMYIPGATHWSSTAASCVPIISFLQSMTATAGSHRRACVRACVCHLAVT